MKRLLYIIALLSLSRIATGQVYQQPKVYGMQYPRVKGDSALGFLLNDTLFHPVFQDTGYVWFAASKHGSATTMWFWAKDSASNVGYWHQFGTGSGGGTFDEALGLGNEANHPVIFNDGVQFTAVSPGIVSFNVAQFDGSGNLKGIPPSTLVYGSIDTTADKRYALANMGTARNIADSAGTVSIDNVGLLNTTTPFQRHGKVEVLGFYNPNDGGGGTFYWDDTATVSPVPGIIAAVSGITTGRWKRKMDISNGYNLLWFGGQQMTRMDTTGNGTPMDTLTNNVIPLRNAVKYIAGLVPTFTSGLNSALDQINGSFIYVPKGAYRVTDSVNFLQGIGLRGDGYKSTLFVLDMENGTARSASYRSFITCYGGGSGGTGFPLVTSFAVGYNEFSNFAVTSTYATGHHSTPYHWTAKNAFELRNGFYKMTDVYINSMDSSGVYAFELINSKFTRLKIDNCGQYGFFLDKDVAHPTNTTTTTSFDNCYFRTTRRGPGFYSCGYVISSSFSNGTIFENNGLEDSSRGFAAVILGDSTQPINNLSSGFSFYNCDFERNTGGKLYVRSAQVFLDDGCRWTGNSGYPGFVDFYFKDASVQMSNHRFGPNSSPSIVSISNTNGASSSYTSNLNLDLPMFNLSYLEFEDTAGNIQQYNWLRSLQLWTTQYNGNGDVGYVGNESTIEGGYAQFRSDTAAIQSPVAIGATAVSADPSLELDVRSTTRGFAPPRMAYAQSIAILSPVAGSMEWLTDRSQYVQNNGINYQPILAPNSNGNVGINMAGSTPTHALTLGINANSGGSNKGIAIENQLDDSTNYERFSAYWQSNQLNLYTQAAGTGTLRGLSIGSVGGAAAAMNFNTTSGNTGFITVGRNTLSTGVGVGLESGDVIGSSTSSPTAVSINPTVSSTGTGGMRALWVSPFFSTYGAGNNWLAEFGTNSAASGGGTDTPKVTINWLGDMNAVGNISVKRSSQDSTPLILNGLKYQPAIYNLLVHSLGADSGTYQMPVSSLPFSPSYDTTLYKARLHQANLSPFFGMYASADSAVHLLFLGDSRTGINPEVLQNLVAQKNTLNAIGWCPLYSNIFVHTLALTETGSYTVTRNDNTSAENWGISGSRLDASTGATIAIAPSRKFTQYRIWYNQTPGSGTFTYSIDGASAITINASASGPDSLKYVLVTNANGNITHTLTINVIAGPVRLYGVDFSNPNITGYVVDVIQSGGSTAAGWDGNMGYTAQYVAAINPSLAYIWLGINDAVAGETSAQFSTHLQNVISGLQLRPTASIILSTEMPIGLNWGGPEDVPINDTTLNYNQQVFALGKSKGYGVFDLRALWSNYYFFLNDSSYEDAIHPTASAVGFIWAAVVRDILPDFANEILAGNAMYRKSNIDLPQGDSSIGFGQFGVNGNGQISDLKTGWYPDPVAGWDYKYNGIMQTAYSRGGTALMSFYPTSAFPNAIQMYRQGSFTNSAFGIAINSTGSTDFTFNNGYLDIHANGVVINKSGTTIVPNAVSVLDLSSDTSQVVLFPNLDTTERNSLSSIMPNGGWFWNTYTNKYNYYQKVGGTGIFRVPLDSLTADGRYAPIAGSTSINTIGTIGTGTWQGAVITPTYGGTGINNGSNTLALSGSYTLSGTSGSTLNIGAGGTLGSNAYTSTAYAPIASPSLTGTPTAPTASTGTNTTQLATTQFVQNQIAATGVTSGYYTPALSATNATGVALETATYIQVGNIVYVTVGGSITPSSSSTVALTISLPVTDSQYGLQGTLGTGVIANNSTSTTQSGAVFSSTSTQVILYTTGSIATGSAFSATFMYHD